MRHPRLLLPLLPFFCWLWLEPGSAWAGPLVEPNLGGTVFVGPTSPHPTAVFWNPAAAGLMSGFQLHISAGSRLDTVTIERTPINASDGEPAVSDRPGVEVRTFEPATSRVLSPGGFLGFSWAVRDNVTVGVAVYTPIAEKLAGSKEQLRYHTLGGSFYASYATFSASLRPASHVIVGAGISAVFTDLDLRFALDDALATCSVPPCGVEDAQAAARLFLRSSVLDDPTPAVAFHAGLMLRPAPRLWLGAAYISEPSPRITKPGTFRFQPAPHTGKAEGTGDAEISFRLPHFVHVGGRYELPRARWVLLAGLRWLVLSTHRAYDLRLSGQTVRDPGAPEWMLRHRGLSDAFSFEAGIESPPSGALGFGRRVRLGGRLRYHSSSVPRDAVAADQVDGHELEAALGLELGLGAGLSLSLSASIAAMLPVDVTQSVFSPKQHIACVASGYDIDQCEAARDGRAIPTAAGRYERFTGEFVLGLSFQRL